MDAVIFELFSNLKCIIRRGRRVKPVVIWEFGTISSGQSISRPFHSHAPQKKHCVSAFRYDRVHKQQITIRKKLN